MVSVTEFIIYLLILTISASFLTPCLGINETVICPKTEKQALISFIQKHKNPSNAEQFSSWSNANVDCCSWEGVVCSNLTGHVIELNLQSSFLNGTLGDSLTNLRYLRYLDLSFNEFNGTFPAFIGSFTELEYLDLSSTGFQGTVDSLEWLSSLSRLEHLDMNDVNLSNTTDLFQVINTLPSLVLLSLQRCGLDTVASLDDVKFTSLASLDLSGNFLQFIPPWIFQLSNITYLRLSSNRINGSIPSAVGNLASLNYLDLSFNEFSGNIPNEIAQLCNMQTLDLSFNTLTGNVSNALENTSNCFIGTLEILNLKFNSFSGHMTEQFGELKSLQRLDLANNSLYGPIPRNLGNLISLEYLGLGNNKFTGNLPESMGQLHSLTDFYVDENMLEGIVTEIHFANLTELTTFVASGNHLTLNVSAKWNPSFRITNLKLGSWNLGVNGQIPTWLHTQKNYISILDLANTGIATQVPKWFWKMTFLNLSYNHLHGNIPDLANGPEFGAQYFFLRYNLFSGSLPQIGAGLLELDLSNNLFTGGLHHLLCDGGNETSQFQSLHLGRNNLSGEIPDCWMRWTWLQILDLGNNNISGSIPKSMGLLENLQFLDLSDNSLSGQVPSSLQNCTKLLKIDLSSNKLTGNIPTWLGIHLDSLRILILRANNFSGHIPTSICLINSLQILDLSDNLFSGMIPNCVNNFTAMAVRARWLNGTLWNVLVGYNGFQTQSASIATKGGTYQYDTVLSLVTNIDLSRNSLSGDIPIQLTELVELRSLNLSGNQLSGLIPNDIGNMVTLESLDFSRNSLSGEIPNSMASLTSLNYLNFSYNNLTGRIPQSTQIMSLPPSGFIGNGLCGLPLASNCVENPGLTPEKEDGVVESEVEWMYILVSVGYALGLAVVCNIMIFKKSWRKAYFVSIDNMWDKVYVYASLKLRKHG